MLTKGSTARRDLPLLVQAATKVQVGLGVSIALTDERIHAVLEPGTPTPRARLELVRAITAAGLPCQVLVAPVLPLITDGDDDLDRILAQVAAAGATSAAVFALHLRTGAREWFQRYLVEHHSDLVDAYAELYQGAYVLRSYAADLSRRAQPLLRRHGLDGADGLRVQRARSSADRARLPSEPVLF